MSESAGKEESTGYEPIDQINITGLNWATPEVRKGLMQKLTGKFLNVKRSSGAIESWVALEANEDGILMSPEGKNIRKVISFRELVELNPEIFTGTLD